jgi:hypothetical protein
MKVISILVIVLLHVVYSLKLNNNNNNNNNGIVLNQRNVIKSIIIPFISTSILLSTSLPSSFPIIYNQYAYAIDTTNIIVDSNQFESLSNVVRVQRSLSYIKKDVESGSDVKNVISQIKLLLRNYKLKDSINNSLQLTKNDKREDARSYGNQAVEDLVLIFEYFTDGITDVSTPRDVLQLTLDATKAAEKELDKYLQCFPNDIRTLVTNKINEEFQ